ncbi:hypothetical protein ENSA5_30970 [Enhygromyxa salina]|uniref:Uncharacterized protein n=1 Tax=Enhygromyxa salina TaxID=215803 RepID=A0A2S9XYD0_9BACT|nr:hypothetical protein [Enhygromyxa salina]PRP97864.1 hypothetical protein ENSA5_30970 [Enhygromyxa salina]
MAESVFKWIKDGGLMVAVNTAGNLNDEAWASFMAEFEAGDYTHYIGASLGVLEVTATQRKQAAAAIRRTKVTVAIITDDMLVRGVVTAVSWLGANAQSFPWKDIDRALDKLALGDRKDGVKQTLNRLRDEVLAEAQARKKRRRELLHRQ